MDKETEKMTTTDHVYYTQIKTHTNELDVWGSSYFFSSSLRPYTVSTSVFRTFGVVSF